MAGLQSQVRQTLIRNNAGKTEPALRWELALQLLEVIVISFIL